ncbi:tetratricopeptide repeat protein [Geobacter sp. AOG1]|uniref:tetratricopeptide repeat protein n=1 Tax=Geobacter sp. AOG1 TaxID=1566346 RepID=UPI001CC57E2F|nr:tetratricopeptide repeat protein [Geobacter sp. AOG1]GFE56442.1 O-GlcNAc transferase [Geobacter sp. AOG1]
MKRTTNPTVTAALAAGLVCLLVYLRALGCDFVNYDDPAYVQNNPIIRQLDGNLLFSVFTQPHVGFWMPLTWLSLALDYRFWGLNPVGYHLTNILLHAINTGLVVLIADRLIKRGPVTGDREQPDYISFLMLLLAGLLWGIHPLRVESVAWVTERKDVLNGLFSLGSILCYLRYVGDRELHGLKDAAGRWYVVSLVLFLLSLMAKSVSVVIPAMLLIADWYPLGRFRRENIRSVLVEKIPYLLIAAAISLLTLHFAAESRILISTADLSFYQRLMLSGSAIVEYCRMLLYPVGIIHLYLIPIPVPSRYAVITALVAGFTCSVIYAGRKTPWLPATWFFFIIPLVPVLAFFQNGVQAYAARFTYLPSVAPSIAAAAGIAFVHKKSKASAQRYPAILLSVLIASLLVFYVATTERLIASWTNSETLWSRLISFRPIGRAYFFRGDYYLVIGNYVAAEKDLTTSIRLALEAGNPEVFNLYAMRGDALSKSGRYDDAVRDFTTAIGMYPHPNFYYHRGGALKALGREREAAADFSRAGEDTGPLEWHTLP